VNLSNFIAKNSISKKCLNVNYRKKLYKNYKKILNKVIIDTKNPKKTLNVLSHNFKFNFQIQDLKRFNTFKTIVLVGMGGSILGSKAIHGFLRKKIKKNFYFFDNLNSKEIKEFKKKKLNKVLYIIISKSGNTIETLSNLFSFNIIKKNSKNIILVSERKDNLLFSLSKRFNLFYVEHKNFIGGRYSVFSEVGIIPAYLMGIDIFKLKSKKINFFKNKKELFLKDSTIKLACLLNSKKITNLIFLNYIPELENFLFWCQQLIAESLGKKGKGFLPVISNTPKDHHSLLQLYLDGPKDKLFHIFSLQEKTKVKIKTKQLIGKVNFLHKKTLDQIKLAQKEALVKTLAKNKIPFREFKVKKINEETLGELFAYFILETVIIGRLTNINPFDQPAVEQVKIFTKKLLS
jgi:glucose-6-phosphate isomerase